MMRTLRKDDISSNAPKRNKRKTIVFKGKDSMAKRLAIDADDFLVVSKLIFQHRERSNSRKKVKLSRLDLETMTEIQERDAGRRIWKLKLNVDYLSLGNTWNLSRLPEDIGNLACLSELDLGFTNIKSLPSSIGELKHLYTLDLSWTKNLSTLPDEIGGLVGLTKLTLFDSNIRSLPASIGQLKNLRYLDLYRTQKLVEMPNEIGGLAGLHEFYHSGSGIRSIPASIGGLQHLQSLHLCSLKNLRSLPSEIGNLIRLERLWLNWSGIVALPASIGRLPNLCQLRLIGTKLLSKLPEEIGSLDDLMTLEIKNSSIHTLPHSMLKLKKLMVFDGLGADNGPTCSIPKAFLRRLGYSIVCNGVRWKAPLEIPKLWPHALASISRATDVCAKQGLYESQTPDVIHHLLADEFREAFLGILLERQRRREAARAFVVRRLPELPPGFANPLVLHHHGRVNARLVEDCHPPSRRPDFRGGAFPGKRI